MTEPPHLDPEMDRYLTVLEEDASTGTHPAAARLLCVGCILTKVTAPYPAVTIVGGLAVCGSHINAAADATDNVGTLHRLAEIIEAG